MKTVEKFLFAVASIGFMTASMLELFGILPPADMRVLTGLTYLLFSTLLYNLAKGTQKMKNLPSIEDILEDINRMKIQAKEQGLPPPYVLTVSINIYNLLKSSKHRLDKDINLQVIQ